MRTSEAEIRRSVHPTAFGFLAVAVLAAIASFAYYDVMLINRHVDVGCVFSFSDGSCSAGRSATIYAAGLAMLGLFAILRGLGAAISSLAVFNGVGEPRERVPRALRGTVLLFAVWGAWALFYPH